MLFRPLFALVSLLLLAGCVASAPVPFPELSRDPSPVDSSTKTFTVLREISGYSRSLPRIGLSLPTGLYALEAEDRDYWYFHAPQPVELRIVENGHVTDRHKLPGGIMLSKHSDATPVTGYTDGKGAVRNPVWELSGTEFAWMEGRYWKKNF